MNSGIYSSSRDLLDSLSLKQWSRVDRILSASIKQQHIQKDGTTALHLACNHKAPLNIISILLDQYPSDVFRQNKHKRTALHYAAYKHGEEVCLQIIKVNPDASVIKDRLSKTPLHYALARKDQISSFAVLEALVRANPCSLFIANRNGDTSLDMFFLIWYVAIKNFCREVSYRSMSPKELLSKKIQHKAGFHCDINYIYNIMVLFFETIWSGGDFSLLHSSLRVYSCPWIFCELMLYINSEPLSKENFIQIIITISEKSKKSTYDRIYQCIHCKCQLSALYLKETGTEAGELSCQTCLVKDKGTPSKCTLLLRDEDCEKLELIYMLILENPILCSSS